jgi:hypothetical protein
MVLTGEFSAKKTCQRGIPFLCTISRELLFARVDLDQEGEASWKPRPHRLGRDVPLDEKNQDQVEKSNAITRPRGNGSFDASLASPDSID